MESTGSLAIAAAAFLLTHYVSSTPLRAALVRALGENAYLGLYVLVSFAMLGWMLWAFARAPLAPVWDGAEFKPWAVLIMPFSLILIACGVTTRNPGAVRQEGALRSMSEAYGILRITRHPLMWGIALWALVHLIARGDAASFVFFGTFLLLALSGTMLIDRRKDRSLGIDWKRFADVTSNVPFGAILRGRNRVRFAEIGWWRIGLGLAIYFVFLLLHPWLFGVRPY
jgi:uncharacterized membrane protein